MQVSWSPIASCSSTATTDESTTPDKPQTTRPLPTWRRTRSIAGAAGGAVGEGATQRRGMRRMRHLGMELHAVEAALLVGDGGEGRALADADDAEAGRQLVDEVAVAHPHLLARALSQQPLEQRATV